LQLPVIPRDREILAVAATASACVKPILTPKKYHFKVLGGNYVTTAIKPVLATLLNSLVH